MPYLWKVTGFGTAPSFTRNFTCDAGASGCATICSSCCSRCIHRLTTWSPPQAQANALQARPQLLSAFIEEMDYYDLLTAFEDIVIANALDSFEVDSHGYRSIPEMFRIEPIPRSHTPQESASFRQSSCTYRSGRHHRQAPKENWVGNRNCGHWKKLLSDRSLRVIQVEVAQLLTEGKPVIVHTERPFQASEVGDDDSDVEEDGEYTALKPSAPVRYKPPSSPEKNLARYLGLSSDEEDLKQEHGKPCFDQEDEEDQDVAREDEEQEADEQKTKRATTKPSTISLPLTATLLYHHRLLQQG
ncbi:hypothetical protein GQ600_25845 [Phytophthora cactorum]|nr:hypothetical protein GQ600_25845 [Phytophthora cactorum]